MKVVIASDHAGFDYKKMILPQISEAGFDIVDLGAYDKTPSDYPQFAELVAEEIQSGRADRGILICGSGVGVSVVANKFKGIRAGVCHDSYSARQSVEHDDANVLCLGERIIGTEMLKELVFNFLNAKFSHEERHVKRLQKLETIEDNNFK